MSDTPLFGIGGAAGPRDHAAGVARALDGFFAANRGTAATPRPARSGTTPEGRILRAIKDALQKEPDLWLLRNTTGFANHDGRKVTYGLAVGGSDFVGIVRMPHFGGIGRWFAIEVKTPTGRTTDKQDAFLAKIRAYGGFACVVRSVADARAALARCRAGESS